MRFKILLVPVLIALSVWVSMGSTNDTRATGVAAIAAGWRHTCALSDGNITCWGDNQWGQLGAVTRDICEEPIPATLCSVRPADAVNLGSAAASVTAGFLHSCAITVDGGVKCWGANYAGQLGNGELDGFVHTDATDVAGLQSDVAGVSAGSLHTCALTSMDEALCWGANDFGQLGDGTTIAQTLPVAVQGPEGGVVAVSAGGTHTCAMTATGGAYCWGDNQSGQLGDGTTIARANPVEVLGLSSGVVAIDAGIAHTCALMDGGTVKCWGDNFFGAIGNGTDVGVSVPADVIDLPAEVLKIAVGQSTCAILNTSDSVCWGNNFSGQLGATSDDACGPLALSCSFSPIAVEDLDGQTAQLDVAGQHACAVSDSRGLVCWGRNDSGQLGIGRLTGLYNLTPRDVAGLGTKKAGNADCTGGVNSIDAALILQLNAGLISLDSLPCANGDANGDGEVTSIDAALVLQFTAGLLSSLPP